MGSKHEEHRGFRDRRVQAQGGFGIEHPVGVMGDREIPPSAPCKVLFPSVPASFTWHLSLPELVLGTSQPLCT